MQRIIKFQGISIDGGDLIQGDLIHGPQGPSIQRVGETCAVPVVPESVGQFTGFRDKKNTEEFPEGQEIYEGDTVVANAVEGEIRGIVRFGTYGTIHTGFYIDWRKASHGTRQDLSFWVPRLTVAEKKTESKN